MDAGDRIISQEVSEHKARYVRLALTEVNEWRAQVNFELLGCDKPPEPTPLCTSLSLITNCFMCECGFRISAVVVSSTYCVT